MCLIHDWTTSFVLIFMLDVCIFVFFNYVCSETALLLIKMITEIMFNWCILYLLWFRSSYWFFRMCKFSQMKPIMETNFYIYFISTYNVVWIFFSFSDSEWASPWFVPPQSSILINSSKFYFMCQAHMFLLGLLMLYHSHSFSPTPRGSNSAVL